MLVNFRHIRLLRSYGNNKLGSWQPDGVMPKKMQLKDTSLLDEHSVKTRKEGRIELARQRFLLQAATNKYSYQHGNHDMRQFMRWILYGGLIVFSGAFFNMYNNMMLNKVYRG